MRKYLVYDNIFKSVDVTALLPQNPEFIVENILNYFPTLLCRFKRVFWRIVRVYYLWTGGTDVGHVNVIVEWMLYIHSPSRLTTMVTERGHSYPSSTSTGICFCPHVGRDLE